MMIHENLFGDIWLSFSYGKEIDNPIEKIINDLSIEYWIIVGSELTKPTMPNLDCYLCREIFLHYQIDR